MTVVVADSDDDDDNDCSMHPSPVSIFQSGHKHYGILVVFMLSKNLLPVFRIHIHWIRIRSKIWIQIQKTTESGSGSKLELIWNYFIIIRFSCQKKSNEKSKMCRYRNVFRSKIVLWWINILNLLKLCLYRKLWWFLQAESQVDGDSTQPLVVRLRVQGLISFWIIVIFY